MAKTKPEEPNSLRAPRAKKPLGLSVPPALRMPHDDLIHTLPSQTSHSSQTSQTSQAPTDTTSQTPASTTGQAPVAPVRDFTKVANSIHREAIPAGVFTGKSKQLYDCLYSLTRGAIKPARSVRVSRPRLMKLSHIGARTTFDTNVERLVAAGLLQVRKIAGEHDGNEYTVLTPEEVSMPSQSSLTSLTSSAQNLVGLVGLETSQTSHTLSVDSERTSALPKTSFKTNTEKTDDEAFAALVALLRQAAKEVTGREPSASEVDRWREVAEVLVTELKIAAGRTSVSSVPAFLAEHLRRRLFKKDQKQLTKEEAEASSTPAARKVDATECPDCYGAGLWYPQGYDKGVARCRHEKLSPPEGD